MTSVKKSRSDRGGVMAYPPLQEHNPFKIQHRHHLFTKRLLFEHSEKGKVWVLDIAAGDIIKRSIRNRRGQWFKRRWNQQAEKGVTKYEVGLHDKVEDIKRRQFFRAHRKASEYFAAWVVKSRLAHYIFEDAEIKGCSASVEFTVDQLEKMESRSIYTLIEKEGCVVTRGIDQTWFHMKREIDKNMGDLDGAKWQLLIAPEGSFVAPMHSPPYPIIPISDRFVLWGVRDGQHKPRKVSEEAEIQEINRCLVEREGHFIFSRAREALEKLSS